jgi:hypothetical protein
LKTKKEAGIADFKVDVNEHEYHQFPYGRDYWWARLDLNQRPDDYESV